MRIDHIFNAIGDQFARWQRIKHAIVANCNAVIDGNCVELFGHAPCGFYFARDQLAQIFQMHVARHELCE